MAGLYIIHPDEGYNGGQAPPSSIYNGGGGIKNYNITNNINYNCRMTVIRYIESVSSDINEGPGPYVG